MIIAARDLHGEIAALTAHRHAIAFKRPCPGGAVGHAESAIGATAKAVQQLESTARTLDSSADSLRTSLQVTVAGLRAA